MPLGMEVGLGPGDFVFDGDPAPRRKQDIAPTQFSSRLLWPNGWMDEDATWYGSSENYEVGTLAFTFDTARRGLNGRGDHPPGACL